MTPVFLDTVGLIAVWDRDDQWHSSASHVFLQLLADNRPFVTTPAVLLECANAASRQPFRADVCDLRDSLIDRQLLIEATAVEAEQAWREYRTGATGAASVVDLLSFAVMRRLSITEAFTNDKHFVASGFKALF